MVLQALGLARDLVDVAGVDLCAKLITARLLPLCPVFTCSIHDALGLRQICLLCREFQLEPSSRKIRDNRCSRRAGGRPSKSLNLPDSHDKLRRCTQRRRRRPPPPPPSASSPSMIYPGRTSGCTHVIFPSPNLHSNHQAYLLPSLAHP